MKLKISFACIAIIVIAILTGSYHYLNTVWLQPRTIKPSLYTLRLGSRLDNTLSQLVPLSKPEQFAIRFYLRLHPEQAMVKAGTYKLPSNSNLNEIAAIFRSGKVYQYRITLVEGETFNQWWNQLVSAPGMAHSTQTPEQIAHSLGLTENQFEGLLLPETYYYTHDSQPAQVLSRAYQAMQKVVEKNWQSRAASLPLKTSYQLLILASLIEKETAINSEMPIIASVFINRLNHHMRLQTDPTVIYGLGNRYNGDITRADLKEKTPYNTYIIQGLPPTPIAMPGKAAIEAAAHPANTDYFYFVANGQGGHHFSKSLNEHHKAVRKYILQHE
ncbi:endolytic transglycosylase MltG [Celerinatantimonas sp. YJH-8]|uniref:endolytic transglycosylase MltG n=1 Tax=Celerinatantimonas sp. YJH-8 TaxID=3228714 RepID=UPI0038C677EA